MDSQAFDRNRRLFLLASAVAAASAAVVAVSSCDTPQGMKRSPNAKPGPDSAVGGAGTPKGSANASASVHSAAQKPAQKSAQQADTDADAAKGAAEEKRPDPVQRPTPPSAEPSIRIRTGSLPKSSPQVRIEGPGPRIWIIEPGSGKPGIVAAGPVDFVWSEAGWRVTEFAGTSRARVVAQAGPVTLEVMALRGEPDRLRLRGVDWPGKVRLVPQPSDIEQPVDVVHEVAIETYLPGVLAQELFNKWGVETHRAQAVAARSWALCEMERWRTRRHYDVVAGELGQAWIGATKHQRSLDAVRATRGEVLLFETRVVPAYYSSCCGGQRASARDAISSSIVHDIAPLQVSALDGRDCCSLAPTYRWKSTFDLATFARTLPAWAKEEGFASLLKVDGIRRIDIAARNPAGRPVRFQITDAKGLVVEVPAERLRFALNADPARPGELRPSKERIKSAFIEPLVLGKDLVVSGRGHGHGVGMCQYGAEAMAKKGATAHAILARYYPGAQPVKSYT